MSTNQKAMSLRVSWLGDQRFQATNESGAGLGIDGETESGLSPMQALMASLSTCMGIDVVMILQKMRAGLDGFDVSIKGERNEEPPRYFRKIHLTFSVTGSIAEDRIERAIRLSFEKYCSVFHTLRKDLEVDYTVSISQAG